MMNEGPLRPEPFDDGSIVKLLQCPKCKQKKLPFMRGLHQKAWTVRCRGCDVPVAFHPSEKSLGEVQEEGGGYQNPLVKRRADGTVIDGKDWYEEVAWPRWMAKQSGEREYRAWLRDVFP